LQALKAAGRHAAGITDDVAEKFVRGLADDLGKTYAGYLKAGKQAGIIRYGLGEYEAKMIAKLGERKAAVVARVEKGRAAGQRLEQEVLGRVPPGRYKQLLTLEKAELAQRQLTRAATAERVLGQIDKKIATLEKSIPKHGFLHRPAVHPKIIESIAETADRAGRTAPGIGARANFVKQRALRLPEKELRAQAGKTAKALGVSEKVITEGAKGEIFTGDALKRTATYATSFYKKVADRETVSALYRLSSRFSAKTERLAKDYITANNLLGKAVVVRPFWRGGKYHVMPKGIAAELTAVTAPVGKTASKFLRLHDKMLSWWKQMTLFMPPHVAAYSMRNMASDALNSVAGGTFNMKYWGSAYKYVAGRQIGRVGGKVKLGKLARVQSYKVGKKLVTLRPDKNGFVSLDDLHEVAVALGLSGRSGPAGYFQLGRGIRPMSEFRSMTGLASRTGHKFQRGLAKFPTAIDDASRFGAFVTRIAKGDSIRDAAFNVHKVLYDYGQLTAIERNVMRRVFPFYTWARKNVVKQLERHAAAPGRLGIYAKIKNNIEANLAEQKMEQELLPEWIKTRMGIQVGGSKQFPVFLALGGFIPMIDLMELRSFSAVKQLVENQLGPMPKELIAQWRNFEPFTRQEIERHKGELEQFLGMPMTRRVSHALRNVRLLTWIDRKMKREQAGEYLGAEPWGQALVGLAPYRASREKWVWSRWYRLRKERDSYRQSARQAVKQKRPGLAAERLRHMKAVEGEMARVRAMLPAKPKRRRR